MNHVKALNDSTGQTIQETVGPTLDIFTPYLVKNKDAIFAITQQEEHYGPHAQQKLGIYRPPQTMHNSPVLVFLNGGEFLGGDKTSANGLLYHNVGSFFARKGIITVIPGYRHTSASPGEEATFPSGGEDVSLVLKWLESFDHKGSANVFIMGSSTGGVHLSSFILGPQFLEQRRALASGKSGIVFKGAIELGVPFHFKSTTEVDHATALKSYYGSQEDVERKCPLGLLEAVRETGMSREDTAVPKVLLLLGEFDSEAEIAQPMHDFAALRTNTWGNGVEFKVIKGHNHISPLLALMSGDVEGERWGEEVVEWIQLLNQQP
ncbi:alpha/beta-hydrolase [Penicillium cosmopolitanum]|uniref:Alpha/beta-hydrolase n=1 Tax=Penicillium cosmopolitanum TaxID=1131564 RepID=A0A9W9W750_9EURO|nr:alpha/beta-hydrolase [Penicillium cosmopolitanum]KAJ5404626.1 alpha/beta-hydrolase [Penicillium cosmopolitanum]